MSDRQSTADRYGLSAFRNPYGSLNSVNADTRATRTGKKFTQPGPDPSRNSGNGPLLLIKTRAQFTCVILCLPVFWAQFTIADNNFIYLYIIRFVTLTSLLASTNTHKPQILKYPMANGVIEYAVAVFLFPLLAKKM